MWSASAPKHNTITAVKRFEDETVCNYNILDEEGRKRRTETKVAAGRACVENESALAQLHVRTRTPTPWLGQRRAHIGPHTRLPTFHTQPTLRRRPRSA